MNTDRELLEWAAKAASIPLKPDFKVRFDYYMADRLMWNPLVNDGDALRLAVKLGIAVEHFYSGPLENPEWLFVRSRRFEAEARCGRPGDIDPYAATRRAIVSAAAEIGRQMEEGGAA